MNNIFRIEKNIIFYPKGSIIKSENLFFLIEGLLHNYVITKANKIRTINLVLNNTIFGNFNYNSYKYLNYYECISDVKIIKINYKQILKIINKNPEYISSFFQYYHQRIEDIENFTNILYHKDAKDRLCSLLLFLGHFFGHNSNDGIKISINISQQMIGKIIGASRITINRLIKRLKKDKKIKIYQKKITLIKILSL
uniref:Global nitrogen regulator n=1 Tax=Cyanidium sp. THAL103 TaxID=3027999 RepID=A0A9Y1MXX9_9RHOD|nr:global nitrogen regulator [Cyanidium sp. THAL103]